MSLHIWKKWRLRTKHFFVFDYHGNINSWHLWTCRRQVQPSFVTKWGYIDWKRRDFGPSWVNLGHLKSFVIWTHLNSFELILSHFRSLKFNERHFNHLSQFSHFQSILVITSHLSHFGHYNLVGLIKSFLVVLGYYVKNGN